MQTAYDLVWLAAQRTPAALALVDDRTDRVMTYRAMIDEVDAIAAGLYARGVRPGDVVAVISPNSFAHCLALLALQRINAIPAMMNFRLPPHQLVSMIEDADIRHAVVHNDRELVAAIQSTSCAAGLLLIFDAPESCLSFDACRASAVDIPEISPPEPEQTAFIMYTSGTTGKPKGVLIAHRASRSRMMFLAPFVGFECNDDWRVLGAAPLFHAIGFYLVFMHTLVFNGTYFVVSRFDAAEVLDMIERHRLTFVFGVPTMFQALMAEPTFSRVRVRSVRKVGYGGASMGMGALAALDRNWNAQLYNLYGSTEMMASLYNRSPLDTPTVFDVGIDHCARIVRPGGHPNDEVEPGQSGEIIFYMRSEQMFTGYLRSPGADAEKIKHGWYYTGDVGTKLPGNRIALTGRVDDVIRSGAESIYPEEVEELLGHHKGIRECCVVGVPDPYWGQKVVACIVPLGPMPPLVEINARLKTAGLPGYKLPKAIIAFDALPRNASAKLLRGEIARLASVAIASKDTASAIA